MPPPSFPRGQWSTWGVGQFQNAVWRVNEAGAGGAAPYDLLLTTAGTFTNLEPAHNGETLGLARTQTGGPESPFITWNTAVWDSLRERMILTLWGGDQGESSNEVDEWDFASGTWNPNGRPLHPTTKLHVANLANWPAAYLYDTSKPQCPPCVIDLNNDYAGAKLSHVSNLKLYPLGRHSYGGMVFMPSAAKVWAWGGSGDWQGGAGGPYMMVEWDTVAKQWEVLDTADCTPFGGVGFTGGGPAAAVWDSLANRVLFVNDAGLWAYNPSGAYGLRTTSLRSDTAIASSLGNSHMVFDPVRNRAYILGAPTASSFIQFDFSGGHTTTPVKTTPALTGTLWPTTSFSSGVGFGPGAFYDPVANRVIVWTGGQTLYSLDVTTAPPYRSSPLALMAGGGTDPGTPTKGVWHRIWYVASADVYATINNASTDGAYVFAPVRASVPVLACTDLWQGRNNQNPDTTFGQTANVDGTYVTVFGTNLGDTQGTSTLTLGGVAQRIISWGPAQPPACPAQLVNPYQHFQAIVFQIVASTPLGTGQSLIATVGGVTSAALPFDVVNSGTIRFATTATAGSIIGNNMLADDVVYLASGTYSGLSTPPNAGGLRAIGAAPGATVHVGDATHEGFPVGGSGTQLRVTYFKMHVFGYSSASSVGTGQAITMGTRGRVVGCKLEAPNGGGSLGTIGLTPTQDGSTLRFFCNEFTNCGQTDADDQYHVLYLSGQRNTGITAYHEDDREVAYNYFHDNHAARAVNIFNESGPNNNPIGDHRVHHNVIVNQHWSGLSALAGVTGAVFHDNLLINCGLDSDAPGGSNPNACAIQLNAGFPAGFTPDGPVTIDFYNNTILNGGTPTGNATRGALYLASSSRYTFKWRNNLVLQANGAPYVAPGSEVPTADATTRSNNAWSGAGAVPSWDTSPVTANPLVVSSVPPYDLHLQTGSPCIGKGVAIGGTSTDLDGDARPAGPWSIGADEPVGGASVPPTATVLRSTQNATPFGTGTTINLVVPLVQVGDLICVTAFGTTAGGASTVTGCADSLGNLYPPSGNSYTIPTSPTGFARTFTSIATVSGPNCSVTASFDGGAGSRLLHVTVFTNLPGNYGAYLTEVHGAGSGASPMLSGTLTVPTGTTCLLYGWNYWDATRPSQPSGWTDVGDSFGEVAYIALSGSGAFSYNPTFTGSNTWAAQIAAVTMSVATGATVLPCAGGTVTVRAPTATILSLDAYYPAAQISVVAGPTTLGFDATYPPGLVTVLGASVLLTSQPGGTHANSLPCVGGTVTVIGSTPDLNHTAQANTGIASNTGAILTLTYTPAGSGQLLRLLQEAIVLAEVHRRSVTHVDPPPGLIQDFDITQQPGLHARVVRV